MKIKYLRKLRKVANSAIELRDYGIQSDKSKNRYVLYVNGSFICNGNSLEYMMSQIQECKRGYIIKMAQLLRLRYKKHSKHKEYRIIKID